MELEDLGYTDVWSSEANGADAFTPLALASVWAPSLRLGTAIVPAYTRGPALLAQQVATLAAAAPGRFAFGLGTSSDVIVERWNGLEFDDPYYRVRDTVRFLRSALTGAKTNGDYRGFASHGFRLGVKVPDEGRVPIFVAALREGMLHRLFHRRTLEVSTAVLDNGSHGQPRSLREIAPVALPSRNAHTGSARPCSTAGPPC